MKLEAVTGMRKIADAFKTRGKWPFGRMHKKY
jgi:hypothetical protein